MRNENRILALIVSSLILCTNVVIATEPGVDFDREYLVESGGAELYIRVRAHDVNKPVLLYLHGGPGEANGPLLFQAYAGPELEKHFVVGYLHQRHTCLSPRAPLKTLTVRQYIDDVQAVVTFLREQFERDKILLLGHSFGGGLGYLYLLEHEDDIERFVSAGGAFSTISIEENGYQTVMELAREIDSQEAIEALEHAGPPPYETIQEGMIWRMLGMRLLESTDHGIAKNLDMSKVVATTGIDTLDPDWQNKSMEVAAAMWKELAGIDIEDEVENIDIPLLVITGAEDIMVPFSILKQGYANYGGEKDSVILKESNHMMFVDEPALFVSEVVMFFEE